jgi:hypothetical protein
MYDSATSFVPRQLHSYLFWKWPGVSISYYMLTSVSSACIW